MRIVVCHACCSWVPQAGNTCPACHLPLDITRPDPPFEAWSGLFGEAVTRLGMVRVERTTLPAEGSLVGTTTGLMFLPQLQPLDDGGLMAVSHGTEQLRETGWFPWRFWSRPQPSFGRQFAAALSQTSSTSLLETDLVTPFFESPGAWFVPLSQVIRLQVRGTMWTLSRGRGQTVRFRMCSPATDWQPAWRQLANISTPWKSLAPRM
jgi:hypothetical protein